ncbi:MAG: DegT/DnrJ/EryC1/StrS family aminotransferase [Candidatus Riflebacteria bacterium]|nr:DegT/DnrJ/EryC1/StrS family aminotransferase [Candidatus Riflebacteria bacterium]
MIPQTNPKLSYIAHKNEIDTAIAAMLDAGRYILGEQVRKFEEEFAAFLGAKYSIGVGNGTDAVELALRALKIGQGDVVATVAHTAVATVAAIELSGAKPLFIDIRPDTFVMDPEKLKLALTNNRSASVKAVLPVHLYGNVSEVFKILEVASEFGIPVIEDCAQAHGAKMNGRFAGTSGVISAFSFYPTKNLGALGDGGAVVTSDENLKNQVTLLREYGWKERYVSHIAGKNSRLDEIQAAILRVKLKYLQEENSTRQNLARMYINGLGGLPVTLPVWGIAESHVFHQFVIRTSRRDDLKAFLKTHGVDTLIHYPVPVHLQPAYLNSLCGDGGLKQTEMVAGEILSLPMFPQLSTEQVSEIVSIIRKFFE